MSDEIQGEPLHLMLVEDNEAHAELIKRCFEQHRIANRITYVVDGQAALDYLFGEDEYQDMVIDMPHVVILDNKIALEQQNRLTAILEATPDLICIADIKGFLTYLNEAGFNMWV